MADTQVLGTCVFGRAGSSPASRTSTTSFIVFQYELSENYGKTLKGES